jgi:hypothetical protein
MLMHKPEYSLKFEADLDELEARPSRIRRHLRRPVHRREDLLIPDSRNTIGKTGLRTDGTSRVVVA